ncbi:hypothetical protein MSAN_01194400 [Mycena sanguinolenta]|uniref:Uncharacterized protein n=1 Tax=Mycena sanguinolenta TaxID=230812 RepID=A0A8H6YG75_9AGAR|nr:hypothetical protein MSAN_01194400 [Mycena sanguinolenta]
MRFRSLSLFFALLLSSYSLAQGNDTIGSLTARVGDGVIISYQWFGEPGHELKNITVELLSGAAGASVVEDILGIHYSESDGTSFSLPGDAAYPAGDYFVRMNATIFNGASQLGGTTALSNTFAITGPQCALSWTPVSSITDPGYTPLRIESPSGSIISQQDLNGPDSGISFTFSSRDHTYSVDGLSMTMEVLSVDTVFSAGVQTIPVGATAGSFFTGNTTLNPGTWKMRVNCSSLNPENPGSFVMVSDNFFIVPLTSQTGQCPGNATSASSASAPSASPSSSFAAGGSSGGPTSQSGSSLSRSLIRTSLICAG